jgi:hypothetical protein
MRIVVGMVITALLFVGWILYKTNQFVGAMKKLTGWNND